MLSYSVFKDEQEQEQGTKEGCLLLKNILLKIMEFSQ